MSIDKKLVTILLQLEKSTERLDNIDTKIEKFNERLTKAEAKMYTKCKMLETDLLYKVNIDQLEHFELRLNELLEENRVEQIMRKAYDKCLNIIIYGLKEGVQSTLETKEKTVEIFEYFFSNGLQLDPTQISYDDVHRLPQRPLYIDGVKKTRPIIFNCLQLSINKRFVHLYSI